MILKKNTRIGLSLAFFVGFYATLNTAAAQSLDAGAQVYVESAYDDNAFRSDEGEEKQGEMQNRASLSLETSYDGFLQQFNLSYSTLFEEYTEGSRDNDTSYSGEASYQLGNEQTYYDLEASHRKARVLNAPDAEFETENTRNQTTVRVSPGLKTRSDRVDQLLLKGIFSEVVFDDSSLSAGKQQGGRFTWRHRLPRVNELGANITYSKTEFDDRPDIDYETNRATAFLTGQTREVSYEFTGGQQTIHNILRDLEYTGFVYSVDFGYERGASSFRYTESLVLTDTSFGEFISDSSTGISIGGEGSAQDNVEQFTQQLSWENSSICGICDLAVSISNQEIAYFSLPVNNYRSSNADVSVSYQPSALSDIDLSVQYRITEYEFDPDRESDIWVYNLSYQHRLTKMLSLRAYVQRYERELSSAYKSNRVGLRIIADFD